MTDLATGPDLGEHTDIVAAASPRRGGGSLGRFVARRLATGVLALVAASIIVFLGTRVIPGSAASSVLGRDAPVTAIHALDRKLGLDRSVVHQYLTWLGGMLRGNLGNSLVGLAQGQSQAPIWGIIRQPLENTFLLAAVTAVLLIPMSIALGMWSAVRGQKVTDHIISTVTLVMISMPEFVAATLLLIVFFVVLGWFPPVSLIPPGALPLAHPNMMVLPVLTLLWTSVGWTTRLVRSGTLAILDSDYIQTARLSGLPERVVMRKYLLRNALAPSVQIFAQAIQYMFGGVIVVETVFDYPGIGARLVSVVQSHDNTLLLSTVTIIAAVYILINIAADVMVVLLVPKLRTGGS